MILSNAISSTQEDCYDPSQCNTQQFYDRDVEFLLCNEDKNCPHKRYYNNKIICDCPAGKS